MGFALVELSTGIIEQWSRWDHHTFDSETHAEVEIASPPDATNQRWDFDTESLRDATAQEIEDAVPVEEKAERNLRTAIESKIADAETAFDNWANLTANQKDMVQKKTVQAIAQLGRLLLRKFG